MGVRERVVSASRLLTEARSTIARAGVTPDLLGFFDLLIERDLKPALAQIDYLLAVAE